MDVRVDNVSRNQAHEKVVNFLQGSSQNTIFTPNPEMLVDSRGDYIFKNILNSGSLNLCDGRGLQLVSKEKIKRIPGSEFMIDVCAIAEKMGESVYFLGSDSEDVIRQAHKNAQRIFPKLDIVGANPGIKLAIEESDSGKMELKFNKYENNKIINDIILSGASVLFVGFGHNKQERWIDMFLKDLPSVKIAVGVGGSFDFLAGKLQRAPRWMRELGLEWLWRLSQEPWRAKRIWKATFVFLFLILKERKIGSKK